MTDLDGFEGFDALAKLLRGETSADVWRAKSPAIERLRVALTEDPQKATALDLAVLVRQVLRHEYGRRDQAVSPSVIVAHPRLQGFGEWDKVGCDASGSPEQLRIESRCWRPSWLVDETAVGVDDYVSAERIRRRFGAANSQGDPFLASVGRASYRSPGQRAAVRAALTTPPGATLAVALPTGEGKSMVFQLIHSVGFAGAGQNDQPGVTLVIVPTVALGLNHEQEAVTVCSLQKPLAYQGGSTVQNKTIADRIRDGSQGLCFASPEAACGALRGALRQAAESGFLRAMVIDEAHLVDQWGTGFRTEFQELSGLRRELMAAAPPIDRMRTILLSATLTDSSLETLRALFGSGGEFQSLSVVKLRPEPDYWVARSTDPQTRIDRVLEALNHAPRPAVLYVTQVQDAKDWHARLRKAGFGRLGLMHGQSGREEREVVVEKWRHGALDIVVGTSAFGLGIDYAHARTVIHACVPETLDRFYQEVGRGGRDGLAALSITLPAVSDFAMAEDINRQKIIGVERGLERWTEMFSRKVPLQNGNFAVRIDGRPGAAGPDIDMVGEANTDWNLRTAALIARAGLIDLLGAPNPGPEQPGEWLEIEVRDEGHLDAKVWTARVEHVRIASRQASQSNLALMRRFLNDAECPAGVLEELYGKGAVGRECSRCSACRADPANQHPPVEMGEPRSPWSPALDPMVTDLFDHAMRLLVLYPDTLPAASTRRLSDSLRRLERMGVAKLVKLGVSPFECDRLLKFAATRPYFVSTPAKLALSRLPNGAEVVLVGADQILEPQNLSPRKDRPRIFIAPESQVAPDGRPLRQVFGGRTLTLAEFNSRLSQ